MSCLKKVQHPVVGLVQTNKKDVKAFKEGRGKFTVADVS